MSDISLKKRYSIHGIKYKEESNSVKGLLATTHPDTVGDILSERVIDEIVTKINDTSQTGDQRGAYRSVSVSHDWIKEDNPNLDEVAFFKPTAKKVSLEGGHYGVEVEAELNEFYKGKMTLDEVKYRIQNGSFAGFSIEYDYDPKDAIQVDYQGKSYNYIKSLTEFAGGALAKARKIANPKAVFYKEIVDNIERGNKMEQEEPKSTNEELEQSNPEVESQEGIEQKPEVESQEKQPVVEEKQDGVSGEDTESLEIKEKEFNRIVNEVKKLAIKELNVQNKIIKTTNEGVNKMEQQQMPLRIKEMNDSLTQGKIDTLKFKECVEEYFEEKQDYALKIKEQFESTGIPLKTTLKVKCDGNKLRIVGGLKVKTVLNSDTNPGAYTEAAVEYGDFFVPGLVETFNNQTNTFGALNKKPHLEGGMTYGWRIVTSQVTGAAVDPDDPSVQLTPVSKLKLRTDIKEYRRGVAVTDYTLHHSRGAMGITDLLMTEASIVLNDMLRDLNNDMFSAQIDTAGNKVLGFEGVANTGTYTTIYGKSRTSGNRLAPNSAAHTYTDVSGALTTAGLRAAYTYVEVEGAYLGDLRILMNPKQRSALYELNKSLQQLGQPAAFGFDVQGRQSWDSIPIIMDSSCQDDQIYVIDSKSCYIVVSKPPTMTGLAKVGAAESAMVNFYVAMVYEQPRRIHLLDNLA